MIDNLKDIIIGYLKQTNSSFADFSSGDEEMVCELTYIDIDIETQKIHVRFHNNWIESGYEDVTITPIELIGYMCSKLQEKGILK